MKPLALFVKLLSEILWALPRGYSLFLGRLLGLLWYDVLRVRRDVVQSNIRLAFPEWPERKVVATGRASLVGMGQTLVEFLLMVGLSRSRVNKSFVFEGLENLDRAFREQKGVLLLTCHLGNGDWGCAGMAIKDYRLNMISKQFKSEWLNNAWFGLRRRMGTGFIREEKSTSEILKALKRNEGVIFVLDQFMGPPIGVRTRFFGHETGTAMGLAVFHQRTRSPLVPAYTVRLPDGRLRVVFEPMMDLSGLLEDRENIPRMTQVYTDKIEGWVRRYPDQWMWLHRRWKEFRD